MLGFMDMLAQQPGLSFLDPNGSNIMDILKQNQDLYGGLQTPDFQKYNPESYQQVGTYNPNMAQATTIQQNPELNSMQMSNLQKMAGLADTGLSPVDQAGYLQAQNIGNQILRGGTGAALQNAEARGQAGTGMEFMAREMAGQQAAQNAQQAALQQASDSAKMRALYTQAFGGAAGGLSQQQFGQKAANANILNQFNMANTNAANQGQMYNLGVAQDVANKNTTNQNQAQQYNNSLLQQGYQDKLSKISGQSGANQGLAQGYAAQSAADSAARDQNTKMVGTIIGSAMGSPGAMK